MSGEVLAILMILVWLAVAGQIVYALYSVLKRGITGAGFGHSILQTAPNDITHRRGALAYRIRLHRLDAPSTNGDVYGLQIRMRATAFPVPSSYYIVMSEDELLKLADMISDFADAHPGSDQTEAV